jgi:PPOX class probable F420-dependent enzyme
VVLRFIQQARVGHLATSTRRGIPQVIPICFEFDGRCIYTAIDQKPKRAEAMKLRRVLNITQNPEISFIVDRYDEDWRKLGYVIVRGKAKILPTGQEHDHALFLLKRKYRQYRQMNLHNRPVIRIIPTKITAWGHQ